MRVLLHHRRTGDSGVRVSNATARPAARLSNVLLIVAFLGTFGLAAWDTFGGLPQAWSPGRLGLLVGSALCVLGIAGTILSQHQMGAAWRLGVDETERTDLVIHGLYAYSRNPIYFAIMVFGLGLGLLVPHPWMVLFLLIGYLAIEVHVRKVEEPHLLQLHGEEFERYRRRVNRYVPIAPGPSSRRR